MKKNNSFQEIWDKLTNSKKILMTLHKGPDGDSLGSCVAMKYVLEKKLDCNVKLISKDNLDGVLIDLSFSKEIEFGKKISDFNLNEFDIVVFLDTSSPDMFGDSEEILKNSFVINIDHHDTNSYFGNLNYVNPERPSCCSILLDFFESQNIEFDEELSNRLLLGICTDSGFFVNTNAEESLIDASKLINKGAKYKEFILKEVLSKFPIRLKKYQSFLIGNLVVDKKNNFGYSLLPAEKINEFGLSLAEIRLGISEIQRLGELNFVFTISDMKDYQKVSFRSSTGINVSLFAKELGGGGHKVAAAADLKGLSLEEAKDKVLEVIKKIGIHKG